MLLTCYFTLGLGLERKPTSRKSGDAVRSRVVRCAVAVSTGQRRPIFDAGPHAPSSCAPQTLRSTRTDPVPERPLYTAVAMWRRRVRTDYSVEAAVLTADTCMARSLSRLSRVTLQQLDQPTATSGRRRLLIESMRETMRRSVARPHSARAARDDQSARRP